MCRHGDIDRARAGGWHDRHALQQPYAGRQGLVIGYGPAGSEFCEFHDLDVSGSLSAHRENHGEKGRHDDRGGPDGGPLIR